MSLAVTCTCGFTTFAPESRAGAVGACPRCLAAIQVPRLAMASAPHGNHDELEFADDGPATPTSSSPPCPKCGTQYDYDAVICVACGINLLTGAPLSDRLSTEPVRVRRSLRAQEEEELQGRPFWRILLGIFLQPLSTLESLAVQLERNDILAKMAILYVASFAALAAVGVVSSRKDHDPAIAHAVSEIERVGATPAKLTTDWLHVKDGISGLPEWGQAFEARLLEPVGAIDAGKPFRVRIQFMEPGRTTPCKGKVRVARTASLGNATVGDWLDLKPGSEPGVHEIELQATREGFSSYAFSVNFDPDTRNGQLGVIRGAVGECWTHKPGWGMLVYEDRKVFYEAMAKQNAGGFLRSGTFRAAMGAAGGIAAIFLSVIGLLIGAGLCTVAARLFGGGGSFAAIFFTFALLTGVANFMQLAVFCVPVGAIPWIQGALIVWGAFLHLAALMKVFDLDILAAILTVVAATAIKLLAGAWLVFAILKLLGHAA